MVFTQSNSFIFSGVMNTISSRVYPTKTNNPEQTCLLALFGFCVCVTDVCVCVCIRVCVCVLACLLYNKHWSKTGPSCQATAVTTNNDYPLPAPQFLLHNHQHRGDPPLLGEQCIHEWASSSPKPTLISPLRARQTPSLCVCLCVRGYLLIFVYLSDFSNEHHWLDILSTDPEWFKPFWRWQIIYQSIHMVCRFYKAKKRAVRSSNDAPSQLSWREESYVELLPGFFFLWLKRTQSSAHVSFLKRPH